MVALLKASIARDQGAAIAAHQAGSWRKAPDIASVIMAIQVVIIELLGDEKDRVATGERLQFSGFIRHAHGSTGEACGLVFEVVAAGSMNLKREPCMLTLLRKE